MREVAHAFACLHQEFKLIASACEIPSGSLRVWNPLGSGLPHRPKMCPPDGGVAVLLS